MGGRVVFWTMRTLCISIGITRPSDNLILMLIHSSLLNMYLIEPGYFAGAAR